MAIFSYQPESGVLSGASFETQSEAFLARAAKGSLPASSKQSLSTSGASVSNFGHEGTTVSINTKTFVAPSGGYYGVTCDLICKITNLSNGLTAVGYNAGDAAVIMPVSSGQSVQIIWKSDRAVLVFVPAAEA